MMARMVCLIDPLRIDLRTFRPGLHAAVSSGRSPRHAVAPAQLLKARPFRRHEGSGLRVAAMILRAVRVAIPLLMASAAHAQLLAPAQAAPAPLSTSAARELLIRLKAAVQSDNRRTVASLVLFPLAVVKGRANGSTYVPSVSVFMRVYPMIFNTRIRSALLSQNPDSLLVRDGVALVGKGELSIGTRCQSADPKSCDSGVRSVNLFQK